MAGWQLVHTCDPKSWEADTEDEEFEASLAYRVRLCPEKQLCIHICMCTHTRVRANTHTLSRCWNLCRDQGMEDRGNNWNTGSVHSHGHKPSLTLRNFIFGEAGSCGCIIHVRSLPLAKCTVFMAWLIMEAPWITLTLVV